MERNDSYDDRVYKIAKDIFNEKNDALCYESVTSLQSTLYPFYQQLIGRYPLGRTSDIHAMPIIDLDGVPDDDIKKLCAFYLENVIMADPDAKVRNVKANSTKIDLSLDTRLIERAMIKAEEEYDTPISHIDNNVEYYKELYNYHQRSVRASILEQENKYKASLSGRSKALTPKQLLIFRRSAFLKILSLHGCIKTEDNFSIWRNHYSALLYIDISCWIILQAITVLLTKTRDDTKILIVQQICKGLDAIPLEVRPAKCSKNIFMTYSEFLLFPLFRSHFLQDTRFLEQLQNSSIDQEAPAKEYLLIDDDGRDIVLPPSKKALVYLEGGTEGKRAFADNLKKCEEFITLFNKDSGRNLKLNDRTLKAIYRQLILEKSIQNKRQSKTILRRYLKNKRFDSLDDYYWINEKINMGMYREAGLIKEFFAKNALQGRLYTIVNTILTRLDPIDILCGAQDIFDRIYSALEKELPENAQTVSIDDIGEFLSTMSYHPLDEPMPKKESISA